MFGEFYLKENYTNSRRIIYHLIFWTVVSLLYYLSYRRLDPENAWILVSKDLFSVVTIFYITSYFIIPRFLLDRGTLFLALWIIITYFWWSIGTYLMCYYLHHFGTPNERLKIYVKIVIENGLVGIISWHKLPFYVLDYVYFTALPLGLKLMQTLLNEKNRGIKLQRDNLELEIDFLKSQINPHFLFNTLNNIHSMVIASDQAAADTVLHLSSLMKYTLYQSDEKEVSLEKEIRFINNYLMLEKIRYNEKVKLLININVPENDLGIAPLILFPFVENAFKHGPDKSSLNSEIKISIQLERDRLLFHIANSVLTDQKKSEPDNYYGGIGITNVLKRLEINYKGNYELSKGIKDGCYEVTLSVKLSNYLRLHIPNKRKTNAN